MSRKKNKHSAFSMIELSIIVLIVGIIIAAILVSNIFIKKFRIQVAQTLTISSPVNGTPDSVLWLESSLDKSFKSSESYDLSTLSVWYDIREVVNKNNGTQSSISNYPTYSNSINNIQAVKFDGANDHFIVDGSILNNTDYTIFVLEQRESSKSGNYFIGDSTSPNESITNRNLVLGYSLDGTIKHSQSSDNSYTSGVSSYSSSKNKPRIFVFMHNKSSGKKTYINGLLAATSDDRNYLSGITTLTIGKSYEGQIGEIIVFARALNDEERESIEDYLAKKWNSSILRNVGGFSGNCVDGIVTNSGCLTTCSVIPANGITDTIVPDGSGSLTCNNAENFTGSLPYTCLNGQFNYTGPDNCSCAAGYVASGSSCVDAVCNGGTESTITVSGMSYRVHVFTSSGTLSCPSSRNGDVLVVAGGGAGGGGRGGGGGAGGVVYQSGFSIPSGSNSITVGAGGTGVVDGNGGNGSNSTFSSITATGGGGGGSGGGSSQCGQIGRNGGSGGGGGRTNSYSGCFGPINGGTGISGQGNNGGKSTDNNYGGGGGGGAGAAGANGTVSAAGSGGAGISSTIINGTTAVYYGGGGGANANNGATIGLGGIGGGGNGGNGFNGSNGDVIIDGYPGTPNTGGGGGGTEYRYAGKNGGSGIVVIRYPH